MIIFINYSVDCFFSITQFVYKVSENSDNNPLQFIARRRLQIAFFVGKTVHYPKIFEFAILENCNREKQHILILEKMEPENVL